MKNILQQFRKDESGAVTVDWVVLTAAVAVMAIAAVSTVSQGVTSLSEQIQMELENTSTGTGY